MFVRRARKFFPADFGIPGIVRKQRSWGYVIGSSGPDITVAIIWIRQ